MATTAMTPGQQNLIRILVRCIEQVGEEFRHQGADERFWKEADYVSRLFGVLWEDPAMYGPALGPEYGSNIPLVHREVPTKIPSGEKRKFYDLALFDGENACKAATVDVPSGDGWQDELAKNRKILVAVEVKICWWNLSTSAHWVEGHSGFKDDIKKLIDNIKAGQVKQGYVLVFCAAREHPKANGKRPPYPWSKMVGNVAWLHGEWNILCRNECENIYIYYVTDHPDDAEQHWIPKHPLEVPL